MLHDLPSRVARALAPGARPLDVVGLPPAARAALVADVAARASATTWVLTTDLARARTLRADVECFLAAAGGADLPVRVLAPSSEPPDGRTSPDAGATFERLGALATVHVHERAVLVVPVEALFQKVLPPAELAARCLVLEPGRRLDWDALLAHLAACGYARMERVEAVGEHAVRGGVVDVHPPDARWPIRIELEDDVVASLKCFDAQTQRSRGPVQHAVVGPCREVLFSPETIETAATEIKRRADALGVPKPDRDSLVDAIRAELRLPGIEAYAPAFDPGRLPVAAYVEANEPVLVERPLEMARAWGAFRERLARWEEAAQASKRLWFPLGEFWDETATLEGFLAGRPAVLFDGLDEGDVEVVRPAWGAEDAPVPRDRPGEAGFEPIAARFRAWLEAGVDPVVVASSPGQATRLEELFRGREVPCERAPLEALPRFTPGAPRPRGVVRVVVASLSGGFRWPQLGAVLVTDEEIFGPKRHVAVRRAPRDGPALSLGELEVGARVVHRDFGIGLFRGLKVLPAGGVRQEYLHLEYAEEARLYLPVDRIELVQRYVGSGDEDGGPALSKLGGTAWARTKQRVHERVLEMATELANLAAARRLVQGHAFASPDALFHEFAASFPFEETPDQARAIEDVLGDMTRSQPMDRLVCGDVGYGKTEVAMRAAFLAVADQKQVAVLVPTTVLAQQHAQSFAARFAGWPIRVASISRFRPPAEVKQTLEGLRKGTVDVVIGTHRLLQPDVRFRDLGLVIIDEEHRFGVAQKDRLRRMRTRVDVMSLTATPIPRTLSMSLSGLRDLSVIATPPADRQAIRTYVSRYDDALVQEAIRRELGRGGQVFFVHNRVETIERTADALRGLVPEASFGVAHGQLSAAELERVMVAFVHGEHHVLVTSAIIESGLDIPNANTMLVNRADRFGLAQLYQLRGRVGRGAVQAYAYLLIPDENAVTADAVRRLEALRGLTDLGAGFRLALEDLEIRGAGNLLGRDQSGHVAQVGFDLYQEMVEQAMAELEGRGAELDLDPEVQFAVEAFLPEEYVPDTGERLLAYRQLARARSDDELDEIRFEWIDRFGKLPEVAEQLVHLMALKAELRTSGAVLARQSGTSVSITFHERAPLDVAALAETAARERDRIRLHPDGRVSVRTSPGAWKDVVSELRTFLRSVRASGGAASRRLG